MSITATELKINLDKYLMLAETEDIYITRNGKVIRMFGYTKQDVILFCYDWPFLSPTPYGSLTSHVIRDHLYFRVLNSFVLLILKGAS